MTLQDNERKALVAYRIEKALNALKEACDVASLGHWNLAVQRLYYSTYYAQTALLLSRGESASTHMGVKAMIGRDFVKTGILTKEDGSLLGRLFIMRQTGDYEDSFDWTQADVKPLLAPTEELVNKIIGLIEKSEIK